MSLGVCLYKSDESIARMMHDSANALLAAVLAVPVVVFEHHNWLLSAIAIVLDATCMEVAIVAIVPAYRADSTLFTQELLSEGPPFMGFHVPIPTHLRAAI
jgi:hypothetical protein